MCLVDQGLGSGAKLARYRIMPRTLLEGSTWTEVGAADVTMGLAQLLELLRTGVRS